MIADAVFVLLAAAVLGGALVAVSLRNVYHNALGMGLSLFGIAGLYIYLNAEFLAAMQVIIYVGAIAVAIIFAIMLSRPMWMPQDRAPVSRLLRAGAVSAALFAIVSRILVDADWPVPAGGVEDYSTAGIGAKLLGDYVLPFEVISLVLLVAIIGAIAISRERSER